MFTYIFSIYISTTLIVCDIYCLYLYRFQFLSLFYSTTVLYLLLWPPEIPSYLNGHIITLYKWGQEFIQPRSIFPGQLKMPFPLLNKILSTLCYFETCAWTITFFPQEDFTCMSTLSRSSGAVQVLETAPAAPPATRCRHHIPVSFSSAVNSSGTTKLSPTSKI